MLAQGPRPILSLPVSVELFSTLGLVFYPEGGGNRFLQNVDNDMTDYMASDSRKQFDVTKNLVQTGMNISRLSIMLIIKHWGMAGYWTTHNTVYWKYVNSHLAFLCLKTLSYRQRENMKHVPRYKTVIKWMCHFFIWLNSVQWRDDWWIEKAFGRKLLLPNQGTIPTLD